VVTLPDLSAFKAEVYVRQRDVQRLAVGQRMNVYTVTHPERALPATVTDIAKIATTRNERLGGDDAADGHVKELLVTVSLEQNPDDLRPGGSVRAELDATLVEDALIVPLAALRESAPMDFRLLLKDGTERPIQLGRVSATRAELLGGADAGQEVRLQ
jgi:hypothetical protein